MGQVFNAAEHAPPSAAGVTYQALGHCRAEVLRRGVQAFLPAQSPRLDRRSYARLEPPFDGCEAWLICWPPGTGAAWHDHGSARGVACVLSGSLREQRLASSAPRVLQRLWQPAQVIELPRGIRHDVRNVTARAAYSIHVYDPRLEHMTFYQCDAAGTLQPLRTELPREW